MTNVLFTFTDTPDMMISGSSQGHLVVWKFPKNDEDRKISHVIKENAHAGAVTGLRFFPSQPLFATSSPDNSLRVWIMDGAESKPRRLVSKEGHEAPPNRVRFYGDDGGNILSAGGDSRLRSFSLVTELLNCSLGRASYNAKLAKKVGVSRDANVMPPIVEFAAESAREGGWESEGVHGKEKANIVAIHEGVRTVTTWSYGRKAKCSFRPLHPRFAKNTKVLPTVRKLGLDDRMFC